jgi:hypothetical protein
MSHFLRDLSGPLSEAGGSLSWVIASPDPDAFRPISARCDFVKEIPLSNGDGTWTGKVQSSWLRGSPTRTNWMSPQHWGLSAERLTSEVGFGAPCPFQKAIRRAI